MTEGYLERDLIYNPDIKEQYFKRFPEGTHNFFKRIFSLSALVERGWGQDLFDFNLRQISGVLRSLNPLTFDSARSAQSIIHNYISSMIHHRSNRVNPLDFVDHRWADQFVDTRRKLLFSKSELYDQLIPLCVNKQDAVIIALPFEGIKGLQSSEIRNLKLTDVNFENKSILLTDDKGNRRSIENVTSNCLELIRNASNEDAYYMKNGNTAPTIRKKEAIALLETGFVIKPANTKNTNFEQVAEHVLQQRLDTIQRSLQIQKLTLTNLYRSGMLYMAKEIYRRDGYLSKRSQYEEICEKFNVSKISNHGHIQYNWTRLKGVINIENIEKIYGFEIV